MTVNQTKAQRFTLYETEIDIENSWFENDLEKNAILAFDSSLSIHNSTFWNLGAAKFNQHEGGGALNLQNSDLNISHSEFIQNKAEKGGSIFFKVSPGSFHQAFISDTLFSQNEAEKMGGALHYTFIGPVFSNCQFEENEARYGPSISSYPTQLKIIDERHSILP